MVVEMIQATGPTALFSFCQFCQSASSPLCVRRNLACQSSPTNPSTSNALLWYC